MKDSGWTLAKKTSDYNFSKWGEYMKRAQLAEAKLIKLKRLLLLTDPVVEGEQMSDVQLRQWTEFIKCFPDENKGTTNG